MDKLQKRMVERMLKRTLDYVKNHPLCEAEDVARHVVGAVDVANLALGQLCINAQVKRVDVAQPDFYFYVAYKMGECETCGQTSHYLALGQCPECVDRYWTSSHPFAHTVLEVTP